MLWTIIFAFGTSVIATETSESRVANCSLPTEAVCPPDEVWVECSAECEDTCDNIHTSNKTCTRQCISGCVCGNGLVRRQDGRCVKPEECRATPICFNPQTEWTWCSADCEPTCENHDPNRPCPAVCNSGCICKKGTVKRNDGQCVTIDECVTVNCPKNEVWDKCPGLCPRDSCAKLNPDFRCPQLPAIPLPCYPDCVCINGTLRNPNGICVPENKCPTNQTCGVNEQFSSCSQTCPPQKCSAILGKYKCDSNSKCVPGCECIQGHVRNKYGICIRKDQCPEAQQCGINARYVECGTYCPVTCRDRFLPRGACIAACKEGCACKQGFLRHDNGTCVSSDQCSPPECVVNAKHETCGTACQSTCDNYDKPVPPCVPLCVEGCFCDPGYVKNEFGYCVKPKDCKPKPSCGLNEVPSDCAIICPPQNCESPYTNYACEPHPCKPGCNCIKEHLRNASGICVPSDQCPPPAPRCPSNSVYKTCGTACEATCGTINKTGLQLKCPSVCVKGCFCLNGFVKNQNGDCVKPEDCPQCPVNEKWVDCELGLCISKTCNDLGFPIACPGIMGPCPGGCVCITGYVRNSEGICIPVNQCPSCGGDFNATSGCGTHCNNRCSTYKETNVSCSQGCEHNGCDCKKGYVFNDIIGKCILPENCPVPCNGDHYAELRNCPNPYPPTCATPNPKVCTKACIKQGCQCLPGYVLDKPGGKCRKIADCPDSLGCNGDPNAIIRTCPNPCPLTCANTKPRICAALCLLQGCECKPGFILSKPGGKCIPPGQCQTNITSSSNSSSSSNWSVSSSSNSSSSTVIEIERNNNSSSGSQEQTSLILCPMNEKWVDCVASYCIPKYCSDLKKTLDCPHISPPCPGGCICVDGYLRNNSHVCIPKGKCPKITFSIVGESGTPCNDPNAVREQCAPAQQCRPTCAVPNPTICPELCVIDSCVCKPGFILSKKGGKCIKPNECPQNLGCNGDQNAVVKECPQSCPSTCDTPDAFPCKKLCVPLGCECKHGYLRSENGTCILPNDCKGGNPCGLNATFVPCKVNCPRNNNDCPKDDSRDIIICDPPPNCLSGCICKLNHRRDDYGNCIMASECPPVNCTRPNEIWDPCPSACLAEYCEDIDNQPTVCNTLVLNCQPQCVCKKGFFRNKSEICIPAKQCPKSNNCG